MSETSSNLSYMTQSAFKGAGKKRGLDIIKEDGQKDEEEEEEEDDKERRIIQSKSDDEKETEKGED